MDRSHRVSAACGQIYLSFIRNHKSNYVCMKFRLLPLGKYILFVPSYSQNCLVRPLPGYEFYPLPDAQVHNNIFLFLVKRYTRIRCTSQKTVGVQNMAATKSSKDESRPKMIFLPFSAARWFQGTRVLLHRSSCVPALFMVFRIFE